MSQFFKAWMRHLRELERQDAVCDPETPKRLECCHVCKADQLRRARDEGLLSDEPATAAGETYQPSAGQWRKGRRVLTDEQIDSFSDQELLQEFVRR